MIERTGLTIDDILRLLSLCLNATFVSFMEQHYQQVQGTAMGSPVSVVVADIVMQTVEQNVLETFPARPWFLKRYVDDTLTVVRQDQVDEFHRRLNNIEQRINFTIEMEKNSQISVLDVLLHREDDGSIQTSVYRKPTHTGRYLHYHSDHPSEHLRAVMRFLFGRVETHCSNTAFKVEGECKIMEELQGNGYPKKLFESTRKEMLLPKNKDRNYQEV